MKRENLEPAISELELELAENEVRHQARQNQLRSTVNQLLGLVGEEPKYPVGEPPQALKAPAPARPHRPAVAPATSPLAKTLLAEPPLPVPVRRHGVHQSARSSRDASRIVKVEGERKTSKQRLLDVFPQLPEKFGREDVVKLVQFPKRNDFYNAILQLVSEKVIVRAEVGVYRKAPGKAGARKTEAPQPAQPPRPAPPVPPPPATPLQEGNKAPVGGPLSADAIAIGKAFVGTFTATDLNARLEGTNSERDRQAQLWLANWKNKGWISTVAFGQYVRTDKFGQMANPGGGL